MATDNKELAVRSASDVAPGFDTVGGFEALQRITKMFAFTASILPQEFRGEMNFGNCAIALEMAFRLGLPPMAVFQNLYIVSGKPAWSAAFLVACLNKSGRYTTLRYEFTGKEGADDWGCRAVAKEIATGETLRGANITIAMAKAEGWYGKNNSKWRTMPEQMLRYRAASFFVRAFAPEIAMGLHTEDELRDAMPAETYARRSGTAEEVNAVIDASVAEAPKRGRPRKAKAEPAPEPAKEIPSAPEAEEAVIVEPSPAESEPVAVEEPAQTAQAQEPAPDPRRAFQTKCAQCGSDPASVLEACLSLYPAVSMEDAVRMMAEDDDAFRLARNKAEF